MAYYIQTTIRQPFDKAVETTVAAVDPSVQLPRTDNPELAPIAAQVRTLLAGVIDKVGKARA